MLRKTNKKYLISKDYIGFPFFTHKLKKKVFNS